MKTSRHLIIAASMAMLTLAPALQAKPHNETGQGHQPDPRSQADTRINIDSQLIRDIFRDNSRYAGQVDRLPPGIQRNLERGKALPPGIAKRLDPRLSRLLPSYSGYDWRQGGDNAVLVRSATGLIEAVINGILN